MKHSEKNNDLDNMFKDAFEGFEMEPSSKVWNGIEQELDKKKKGVVIQIIRKYSIAASIVLVLGIGVYQYNNITNDKVINNSSTLAKANENNALRSVDTSTDKKIKKIPSLVQPNTEERRLVDVVEIKSRSIRSSKNIKKPVLRSQNEKEAIELLKKMEEKAENNTTEPIVEPENKRPVLIKPIPVPSPSVALNNGSKTEVGVLEMLNFVAQKVTGSDAELVAVNESKKTDGSVRKSYDVNLGIVKFSRVRNTEK